MNNVTKLSRQTHLEYYQEHQISPVSYDLTNLNAHMERRFSLYAKIGILPLAFAGSRVLEVAAGTGHNSLFIAQTMPKNLVLLEPNPTGIAHIKETYNKFELPHTQPEYVFQKLEDYSPSEKFDIILCENWLGTSQHELSLIDKLGSMVAKQGVLVLTTVSPLGFLPNVLRRYLSAYISPLTDTFERRTEVLVSAFSSHLATLKEMTRSKVDWIHDNMMNPAYFGLCLSIPHLLKQLGTHFDVIGTTPSIAEDWRWFKGMHGNKRQFNEHFLSEYWKKTHNFIDYRAIPDVSDINNNQKLESLALNLLNAIATHEDKLIQGSDVASDRQEILANLDKLIACMPVQLNTAARAYQEVRDLIANSSNINVEAVASMTKFSALFGRETAYISLMRMS